MSEQSERPVPDPEQPQQPADSKPAPEPAKKRSKRRWLKILLGIVAVLLLLVIFAPTLASTGPGRRMILGIANKSLNGKAEVDDWSIGWTGGMRINGLRIRDDQGEVVLQASKVSTELSLLKTLFGGLSNLNLGKTEVEGLDLTKFHIDEQGVPNYARLAKSSAQHATPAPQQPAASSKPMRISGDFHVRGMTGAITAAGVPQTLRIRPSDLEATVVDLNPTKHEIRLVYIVENPSKPQAADAAPATITLSGGATLFDQGKFAIRSLAEQLSLGQVDLSAVQPFLAMARSDLKLSGIANGAVQVTQGDDQKRIVQGRIDVGGLSATGGPLGADVLKTDVKIPIVIRETQGVWDISDLKIVTDFGQIAFTGSLPEDALRRLANNQPPGGDGNAMVIASFDKVAELTRQIPGVIKLLPGVKVESGKVYVQADLWLTAKEVGAKVYADAQARGARSITDPKTGQTRTAAIELKPIKHSLDFTWRPQSTGGFALIPQGELRNIAVVLESEFAKVNGGTGRDGSIAQFSLTGHADLQKLSDELGQFIDLGGLQMAGELDATASSNGDPAKPDAPVDVKAGAELKNVRVAGLGKLAPITEPWLNLSASGKLNLREGAAQSISDGQVTLKSNNPEKPTIDILARGTFDLKTLKSSGFEAERLHVDLAKAAGEFGGGVPAMKWCAAGQIDGSFSGTFDGKSILIAEAKPLSITASGVTLAQPGGKEKPAVENRSAEVKLAGAIDLSKDGMGARLSSLSIRSEPLVSIRNKDGEFAVTFVPATGQFRGKGTLAVSVAGKEILDIAQALGGQAGQAPAGQPGLKKGTLAGELAFAPSADGGKGTKITGNFGAELEVVPEKPKAPISDKLAITLDGMVPEDLSQPATLVMDINGNTLTSKLSDGQFALARRMPDQTIAFNGPLDIARKLHFTINVPQVEVVQAIVNSFGSAPASPAPAAPTGEGSGAERISSAPGAADSARVEAMPPAQLVAGSLVATIDVNRQGQALVAINDLQLTNYRLQRGKAQFAPATGKLGLRFAASIQPDNDGKITAVDISELQGDLSVGQLKMTRRITLAELNTKSPKLTGGIEVAGKLADLLRLIEVLQGARPETYLYSGDYTLAQDLTTNGSVIQPAGSLKIRNFAAYDAKDKTRPILAEELLSVANDLQIDPAVAMLKVNNISIETQSTKAINLVVSGGTLSDWNNKRQITQNFQASLRVDWARLWDLLRPAMDPKTVESLNLSVAGVMDKKFEISGSYPATGTDRRGRTIPLQVNNSIRFLRATGGLAFDKLSIMGLNISKLDIPVIVDKGVASIDKTPPAECNNGTIALAGIAADLRNVDPDNPAKLDPHITIPPNTALLANITLNPILAKSTIGKFNPGFTDASEATGLVNVTAHEWKDVPLSWFARDEAPQPGKRARARNVAVSEGRGRITFSIQKIRLNNFVLVAILGKPVDGDIRQGEIVVDKGMVETKVPILMNEKQAISFAGQVNLQTGIIKEFTAGVPVEMFKKDLYDKVPAQARKLLPQTIAIPFKGSMDKPEFDPGGALLKSVTSGLGKPENLLEGLPGLFDKDKKKPK